MYVSFTHIYWNPLSLTLTHTCIHMCTHSYCDLCRSHKNKLGTTYLLAARIKNHTPSENIFRLSMSSMWLVAVLAWWRLKWSNFWHKKNQLHFIRTETHTKFICKFSTMAIALKARWSYALRTNKYKIYSISQTPLGKVTRHQICTDLCRGDIYWLYLQHTSIDSRNVTVSRITIWLCFSLVRRNFKRIYTI